MKQEDINEIRANRPSPELLAYAAQLKEDAFERGCACINSKGYWDSECAWDGHTRPCCAQSFAELHLQELSDEANEPVDE